MIGGDEWIVRGRTGIGDVETILRFMRHAWPRAIVEGTPVAGGEPGRLTPLFPARLLAEIFIYEDEKSLDSWEHDGLTDENAGAVVYVTIEDDAISFVFDDRDSPTGRLVLEQLAVAVRENRNFRDELKAA